MSNTENGFFFSFCFACAKLLKLGHKSNNKLCDSKLLVPGFYVSVLQGALLYEHYAMILVLVLGGGRKKITIQFIQPFSMTAKNTTNQLQIYECGSSAKENNNALWFSHVQ